jgi:hypothetical protein
VGPGAVGAGARHFRPLLTRVALSHSYQPLGFSLRRNIR